MFNDVVVTSLFQIQYLGNPPISCFTTQTNWSENRLNYVNSYCWALNTYYVPWKDEIPREWKSKKRQMIRYYQWIPLILIVQVRNKIGEINVEIMSIDIIMQICLAEFAYSHRPCLSLIFANISQMMRGRAHITIVIR